MWPPFQIVHRRLAARNILLTFLNEVKIAGFGPQPVGEGEEDGDAEKGKKVRITWLYEEVQVGKDQKKAQSEKDSHSKTQGGKKLN